MYIDKFVDAVKMTHHTRTREVGAHGQNGGGERYINCSIAS